MAMTSEGDIAEILLFKARMDFLLLTMSPDKVRDQLVRDFADTKDDLGSLTQAAIIVSKPE